MRVAGSWSGGKDGCLACYEAIQSGHELVVLLNTTVRESGRSCFHGVDRRLIQAQAEAMDMPLLQREMAQDMKEYAAEFTAALRELRDQYGIEGMVFGDIFLDAHKDWVENVCRDAGIVALEPLWNQPVNDLLRRFLRVGFRAVIVICKAEAMGAEYAGRELDEALIDELTAKGVCPCGENGEYHTLVIDGPSFKRRLQIVKPTPILRHGFWDHWSIDIKEWQLVGK